MARRLCFTRGRVRRLMRKVAKAKAARGKAAVAAAMADIPKAMNANETRFQRQILEGRGKYEPMRITITRRKERKYTPDFLFETAEGGRAIVEVKGVYKLQSEERARLAWEIAAEADDSGAVFVWARAARGGYNCEAWFDGGRRIEKRRVCNAEEFARLVNAGKEEEQCRAE